MNHCIPNSVMLVELEPQWQVLYLPTYVRVYRRVENALINALERQGFEECLFPKIISRGQFEDMVRCIPRFATEWPLESLRVEVERTDVNYERHFYLCHWQCEPFYYLLRKLRPTGELLLYDRSGWTFRAEQQLSSNRLLAFQRIEVMFFVPSCKAQAVLDGVIDQMAQTLMAEGLELRLRTKEDEMAQTGEIYVKDLEARGNDGQWSEILGGHVHGRLLLNGLEVGVPEHFVTGCCGIALSRITNILTAVGASGTCSMSDNNK